MSARFDVRPGETVTAFALGPLEQTEFHGPREAMEDRVDYRFVNGWVDVGDLPCRKATWDEVKTRPVAAMPVVESSAVNLPGFSRRLDFSGFWHVPHRLVRSACVTLYPEVSGEQPFRLGTCGGVQVWVDGVHVAAFEPFTRNAMQETEVSLPLKVEGSQVVIRLEEMAERDTAFFLEMTWLGEGVLVSEVPGAASEEALDALKTLAREVRPSQVCFAEGERLTLAFDTALGVDVEIAAEVAHSVHLRHLPPRWTACTVLRAGERLADLGLPGLADGYHPLSLTFRIGETVLRRGIGFALLREEARSLGKDVQTRKRVALEHAAEHGERRIGTVLARVALAMPWTAENDAILGDTLDGITARRDCSDFVMVPLLWLMARHGEALPEDWRRKAKAAVLGYRYWMTEPGNDAMWFWSENHVLCFHVSQYLAGRLWPYEVFANAGLRGEDHAALGEARLLRWFDAVEEDGLAEWNSAAYYPVDFIGLMALAELGEGEIRGRARRLLDRLFTMIALHTLDGTCAGSMGRAYDKELRAGPLTELSPFAAVAFGFGWLGDGVAALPMFCLGSYAPPDVQGFVTPKGAVEARYVQGHGDQGRLGLWKTAQGMLSACIDGTPGAKGHQQHLVDVQLGGPFARVWVNHPGEDDPWGSARPSFWAGNGVMPRVGMLRDCALVLSDVGTGRLPFSHAYAPLSEFDRVQRGDDWMVLTKGRGAVILKASGLIVPVEDGPGAGIEFRVTGRRTGWALILCEAGEGLAAKAAALSLTLGERLVLGGHGPRLELDWEEGLFVDGEKKPFGTRARDPQIKRHEIKDLLECR